MCEFWRSLFTSKIYITTGYAKGLINEILYADDLLFTSESMENSRKIFEKESV